MLLRQTVPLAVRIFDDQQSRHHSQDNRLTPLPHSLRVFPDNLN